MPPSSTFDVKALVQATLAGLGVSATQEDIAAAAAVLDAALQSARVLDALEVDDEPPHDLRWSEIL